MRDCELSSVCQYMYVNLCECLCKSTHTKVCVCLCVCVCVLAAVEGQMLPTLQAYCFTAFCGNVAVPTLALIRSQSHAWAHGGAELMHTHRHTCTRTPARSVRTHGNSIMRDKGNKWKLCVSVVILFIKVQGTVCACNQQEAFKSAHTHTHTHTHTPTNQKGCLRRHTGMLYDRQYKANPTSELF